VPPEHHARPRIFASYAIWIPRGDDSFSDPYYEARSEVIPNISLKHHSRGGQEGSFNRQRP